MFAPDRLHSMMTALREHLLTSTNGQQGRITELNKQLKKVEERQQRLLEAIETGILELDETTQRRAQQLKASREAVLIELAGVRSETTLPVMDYLKASQVEVLGKVLRQKLRVNGSPLAKDYLNILVDEIVVEARTATIKGSYAALAQTLQKIKLGNLNNQVPSFIPSWCARSDSNARPLGS